MARPPSVYLGLSQLWKTGNASKLVSLALIGTAAAGLAYYVPEACRPPEGANVPPIHDVSTDTVEPPVYVAVMPLRADAPNTTVYGGSQDMTHERLAQLQTDAYPDIKTLTIPPTAKRRLRSRTRGRRRDDYRCTLAVASRRWRCRHERAPSQDILRRAVAVSNPVLRGRPNSRRCHDPSRRLLINIRPTYRPYRQVQTYVDQLDREACPNQCLLTSCCGRGRRMSRSRYGWPATHSASKTLSVL